MQTTSSITSSEPIVNTEDDFYYNEQVDVIDPKSNNVLNGHIVSIRGQLLIVKLDDDSEHHFTRGDNLILKQWHQGREFSLYNRVEIQLPNENYWSDGIVIEIASPKVRIQYTNKKKEIINEWVHEDSERIARVGTHCGKYNEIISSSEEINSRLFAKRKFAKMNLRQEKKFRNEMNKVNLFIKEIKGDGNCLFRAISDQVYGNEKYHEIIRNKCMDYILMEKKFFAQFVEGGEAGFDEYVSMKRTNGVWGDDIELQAMSEMYNRPIQIYLNSNTAMKTFHETNEGFKRITEDDNQNGEKRSIFPIRISYHGKAHYNSIIPAKTNPELSLFVNAMITTKPGDAEDAVINKVNKRDKLKKEKEEEELIKARQRFQEEKASKNVDEILIENLSNDAPTSEGAIADVDEINKAMKESELEGYENELIDSVKKISLENANEANVNNEELDYYSIPAIQTALEFGFSLDDAIIAYSIYGNKSDLILQYLYSMNMN